MRRLLTSLTIAAAAATLVPIGQVGATPVAATPGLRAAEWEQVTASAPWTPRAGLQAVEVGKRFLVLGGRSPLAIPGVPGASTLSNEVWASTDQGATWSKTADAPWPARAYFQAVADRGKVFVIGGQNFKVGADCTNGAPVCSDFFSDVWASGDAGRTWTQQTAAAGWVGRAGLSAVALGKSLYVLAGSTNDDSSIVGGPPARKYFNDVWRSDDGGKTWEQVTAAAPWEPRAGAAVLTRGPWMYLFGGEEGFTCDDPAKPCPPYFNDVWRSRDGATWEKLTAAAPWAPRPGHKCELLEGRFVCFGGFGLPPAGNPVDMWVSADGAKWQQLPQAPWDAAAQDAVKYDFAALSSTRGPGGPAIYTFGGDRETFDFTDPANPSRVDHDVWRFGT
ncbi:MAG: sialidase family protein [Acidimicrobiia bacterium]